MSDVIPVAKNGKTYALFFPKSLRAPEGVRFLTEHTEPLQVGLMDRPAGHVVQPHAHPPAERHLHSTPEFLYIESGSMIVKVFDEEWTLLNERTVGAGDFLLLLAGGHSMEVTERARFMEVKQGPYVGVAKDKIAPPKL